MNELSIKFLLNIFRKIFEWFNKPKLIIKGFDNADNIGWINLKTNHWQSELSYWIRIHVKNSGKSIIKNCIVKLMDVKPRLNHFNPLQLLWVRSGEELQPKSVDLYPNDERIFDIGYVTKNDNIFHIHPASSLSGLNSMIDYEKNKDRCFTIKIFSDNHKCISIKFVLIATPQYNEFKYKDYIIHEEN